MSRARNQETESTHYWKASMGAKVQCGADAPEFATGLSVRRAWKTAEDWKDVDCKGCIARGPKFLRQAAKSPPKVKRVPVVRKDLSVRMSRAVSAGASGPRTQKN